MTYTGRQYQRADDTAPPIETNPAVVEMDDDTDVQVIRIDTGTGTTPTPASTSNPVPTSVQSSALPSGAATSAKQDLLLTELQAKADLSETQPVSAAALPLPSGAATSAKQDDLLTELQLKADLTERQPIEIVDEYGFEVENTPMGEMRVVIPYRLAGGNFEGATVDPNFWTATAANSATATQGSSQVILASGTNAAGSIQFNSFRRARYVSGASMRYRSVVTLSAGIADNVRRWGVANGATMPTITDGAYFRMNGTTFGIVTLKGGTPAAVESGSFNGALGATYDPGTTIHTYEIYWTNSRVYFVIGGELLHTVTASSATWAATMSHHVYMSNINAGNTTDVNLTVRVASIARLGNDKTEPTSKFQVGTTAGVICKYGAGNIHGITISAVSNTAVVTLYDNTAASGTILWSSGAMGAQTQPYALEMHNIPFQNGLTLVISGANASALVVYE